MIIGKRHLALAALILALGAAVYLNWQFAPSEELIADTVAVDEDSSYLDAEYAATEALASSADAEIEGEVIETGKKTDYFEQTKAEREKTRNDSLATLKELIDDPTLSDSQKAEAVNQAAKLAAGMEKEAAVEALVLAKGYNQCIVVISDAQVNVIIPAQKQGITPADAAIIRDIVIGQIDISPSCIKIIEAK